MCSDDNSSKFRAFDSLPMNKPSIICVIGWLLMSSWLVIGRTEEFGRAGAVWGGDDSVSWLWGDDGQERGCGDSHRFGYKSKKWLNELLRIRIWGHFVMLFGRQRWISSQAAWNADDNCTWSSFELVVCCRRVVVVLSSYKIINWLSSNRLLSIDEWALEFVFRRLREILSATRSRIEWRIRCSLWRNGEPQSNIVNGILSLILSANSVGLMNWVVMDEGSDDGSVITGNEGVVEVVGVNANVCGRRRLAGGEESSGNDENFNGDWSFSSINGSEFGELAGWLRHVRKIDIEHSVLVLVRNRDVGRVGVVAEGSAILVNGKVCVRQESFELNCRFRVDSWLIWKLNEHECRSLLFVLVVFLSVSVDVRSIVCAVWQ